MKDETQNNNMGKIDLGANIISSTLHNLCKELFYGLH